MQRNPSPSGFDPATTRWTRRQMLKAGAAAAIGVAGAAVVGCGDDKARPEPAETVTTTNAPTTGASATAAPPVELAKLGTWDAADFDAPEILGRPTADSITVNTVAARVLQLSYEYGTTSGAYDAKTAVQSLPKGTPTETLISGLRPNTRYFYRARYGEKTTPERSFVTQRAASNSFSFAVQGDSHPERIKTQYDPDLYSRCLLNAAARHPDFYMTIGDDFSVDTLKTVTADAVRDVYLNQRRFLPTVGAPVFLVNGNHEQAALANIDGTPNNVAVWGQNSRNSYFPQPAPDSFYTGDTEPVTHIGLLRDYYAFTWGDALFAVIDPYWHSRLPVDNTFGSDHNDKDDKKGRDLWDITLGETQYKWLKTTLETSQAKFKFVFAHHVLGTGRGGIELAKTFEWGDTKQFAAKRPGWAKPIHNLMVDTGVTIFFQGHDHIFVRQELDGVIYQSLPVPADPNYSLFNADAYRTGDKYPNSGHVAVTVDPAEVTVDYVLSVLPQHETATRKNGQVAYSYKAKSRTV